MKFITVALLFLLTIPGLAQVQKIETDSPFEGIIFGCSDGVIEKLLPEPIALTGIYHSVFQMTENKNLQIIDQRAKLTGTAIGLVSKTEYPFTAQYSSRATFSVENLNNPEAPAPSEARGLTHKDIFNIPGLYQAHFLVRSEFSKDSRVPVYISDIRVRCPTIDFP